MTPPEPLLTVEEMRAADQHAVAEGVPSLVLMENAGRAVADEAMRMCPKGAVVVVLCGPGNNGGDGFVAARLLKNRGYAVRVGLLGPRAALKGDAAIMADRWDGIVATAREVMIADAGLAIDALFGAGLSRPLEGDAAEAIARLEHVPVVLAVDVPSGLDGTTGSATGPVVSADRTVTFFRRKPGHLLLPGRVHCGSVALYDIGIPVRVLRTIRPATFTNSPPLWLEHWPRLRLDAHKYTRGHALVASGGIEMSGAARLAARGALRIGAGLVTVASPPDAMMAHASQLNATLLRCASGIGQLREILEDRRFTAAVIGPGLGRAGEAMDKVAAVLAARVSVVLDADALTVAAADTMRLFKGIAAGHDRRQVVLTPHEGEFTRLFSGAKGSKLERAREATARSGAVLVLKGPDTVIAAPDGRAAINENAPPSLATAGSGDVLAGFITGLIAQGMPAFEASCAAVWLHGEAARAFGPGLIAEDLPEILPRVLASPALANG